ncbi:MAG: hypothetical protein DSY42_03000 [Aquifex sp.]|nr:MAG: hypothetical protein DSY42_03000 [Aquifex sp.]
MFRISSSSSFLFSLSCMSSSIFFFRSPASLAFAVEDKFLKIPVFSLEIAVLTEASDIPASTSF